MNIKKSSSYFLICIECIGLGLFYTSNGQDKSSAKDYVIRLGVEEVRLDAVVLDKKGRPVIDLTADDFQVRQDGIDQKLTSVIYFNEYQSQPETRTKQMKQAPSVSAPMLTQQDVHRTIVLVVDNVRMNFVQFCDARTSLKNFIKTQIQPGDLVAIVPTAGGATEFQAFTSDKNHLISIVDNLHWLDILNLDYDADQVNNLVDAKERRRREDELKDDLYMTTSYCIKALRDMPGRKSLFLLSPHVWIGYTNWEDYILLQRIYNELADAALRAGVVVHSLDIKGLEGLEQMMPDFRAERNPLAGQTSQSTADGSIFSRKLESVSRRIYENAHRPIPLSEKTGGLFVTDSNFFSTPSGIGRASEMIKGYYIITYIPPSDTFSKNSKNDYIEIKVKVKRSGCEVHTRSGFFRAPESSPIYPKGVSTLQEAIYSPFRYNDLNVSLISGYIDDPQRGYLLHSWIHVAGKDLNISEAKEGMHSIVLEGVCITSNIDNILQDSSSRRYEYSIKSDDIPWIREHGLRFSIALAVKKPGAYYVRAAMKDPASGKMGSAYQFIEIPDLKKGRLMLSNIFVVNRDDDLPWVRSESATLSADVRKDLGKSVAIRNYTPGETIDYAAVIYNAKFETNQRPILESQFTLLGNGKELVKGNVEAVDLSNVNDLKRIPIRKKIMLEKSIQPGDYILQLQISDNRAGKNKNVASQSLSFKVVK